MSEEAQRKCEHRWRIFGRTPLGMIECERCEMSANLFIVLDTLLVKLQRILDERKNAA